MDLMKKVMKRKRMQSVGNGLCLIMPKKWTEPMGWFKSTVLKVVWHPDSGQIIISKDEDQSWKDEETGNPEPSSD